MPDVANKKTSPEEVVGHHAHHAHGKSVLWPAMYEHLREKGYSKEKAARISNAAWNKKHGKADGVSATEVIKAEPVDADGDGFVFDGTPKQRPVLRGLALTKDRAKRIKGHVPTSRQKHTIKGQYTPEREMLHDQIIQSFMEGVPRVHGTQPEVFYMGGGPGVGKSTLVKTGNVSVPDVKSRQAVEVNSDAIKAMLPEYAALTALGDRTAATYVHQESMDITRKLMARSLDARVPIVFDGTGDNGFSKVSSDVAAMRKKGYKVHANYATTSLDEAWKRVQERYKTERRYVPYHIFEYAHHDVADIGTDLLRSDVFDSINIWDTSASFPQLIASGKKRGPKTIHNGSLWRRFINRGWQEHDVINKAGSTRLATLVIAIADYLNGQNVHPPASLNAVWPAVLKDLRQVPEGAQISLPGDMEL